MDEVKFIEERNRMCNAHSPGCEGCRIDEAKPVISECVSWAFVNPEKAVQIVEEWSAAHPRKTRQSVFLEQWPEANVDKSTGVLIICPAALKKEYRDDRGACNAYSIESGVCNDCRRKFWMQEVE